MANIIELNNISHLYEVGDLHGDFKGFSRLIIQHCKKNSCVFVCGDCGFGFHKLKYYEQELHKFNESAAASNKVIVFVRGNHDDPSYFFEHKLDFSNLLLVPDYTLIKAKNNNVLCVGGGVSIDRMWRKQEGIRRSKPLYWKDEEPVFNDTLIDEFKELNLNIDIVVSHASPAFAFPQTFLGGTSWFRTDKNLKHDIEVERETMTKIYDRLIENGNKIKSWHYGHYHASNKDVINDIEFICNDCNLQLSQMDNRLNFKFNCNPTDSLWTTDYTTIEFP